MRKVNAVVLRQSLGKVLDELDRRGEPIVVHKGAVPRAVLVSLRDFRERFVEHQASEERRLVVEAIKGLKGATKKKQKSPSSVELLRELRGPLP